MLISANSNFDRVYSTTVIHSYKMLRDGIDAVTAMRWLVPINPFIETLVEHQLQRRLWPITSVITKRRRTKPSESIEWWCEMMNSLKNWFIV